MSREMPMNKTPTSRGITTGALVALLVVLTVGLVFMSIKALKPQPPTAPTLFVEAR